MRFRILLSLLAAGIALVSLAVGSGNPAWAAGGGAKKIVIDTTPPTSLAMAGRARGILESTFGKLGVTVEYTQLMTSSQMLEGLVSGSTDFVELGYVGVATGVSANVPFTVVGACSNGGGDILFVPKASTAKSIADLKGKTIAITKGSSSWMLVLRALEKAGMSSKDVKLVNLAPDEGQNAFLTGQVDAWSVWSGQKGPAVTDANSIPLITAAEIGLVPGVIAARKAFVDQNPDLVEAYLKARQQILALMRDDTDATIAAISAVRNTPKATLLNFMKISVPANDVVPDSAVVDLQTTADLLFKMGELKRQVVVKPTINNDYMKRALAP